MRLTGLYFLVDEQVAGPDSDMAGAQLALGAQLHRLFRLGIAAAYYDYRLRSVAGADAGDLRSNLIGPDGRYVSDFDLVDVVGTLSYAGFGEHWPVQLSGDYVRNLGAATDADTGYMAALTIGRASRAEDLRFGYQYMLAETDAVLAAFSHDNLGLATNYIQHALAVDYVLREHVLLNATLYHYRVKDPLGPGGGIAGDWRDRLRLNLLVDF